jgi:hypothetical protein
MYVWGIARVVRSTPELGGLAGRGEGGTMPITVQRNSGFRIHSFRIHSGFIQDSFRVHSGFIQDSFRIQDAFTMPITGIGLAA